MMNHFFRKSLLISLLGHLTVFSIFNLSFGNKMNTADYASVSFMGQLLQGTQVLPSFSGEGRAGKQERLFSRPDTLILKKIRQESSLYAGWHMKPQMPLEFIPQKGIFKRETAPLVFFPKRKEPQIVFHPLLPYSFTLYFRDRQVAHVELMFNLASSGLHRSIEIKRKISSGNLEVDLLSQRYIGHYLFIQQARFEPNRWQSVKIDLSAKND